MTRLVRDLGVAYASRCAGRAPGWAPLPVQYVDYTLWQRAQFGDLDDSDSRIAAQLAYWEQALAGLPERLQLPTDRPYPPVADQRGASVAVDWPAELQQRVREMAGEHNATSFMVMQAALAVLLAKLSASTDVAVGFAIAGRRDPALDELVGFFVNTLVLRVDLAGDPTVAELLAQVRAARPGRLRAPRRALRGARRAAQPDPQPGPSPAGSGDVGAGRTSPGKSMSPRPGWLWVIFRSRRCSRTPRPRKWIWCSSWTNAGLRPVSPPGFPGTVEFRTDVFDADSIEALIERLERVLVAMTADPTPAVVVGGSAGCR